MDGTEVHSVIRNCQNFQSFHHIIVVGGRPLEVLCILVSLRELDEKGTSFQGDNVITGLRLVFLFSRTSLLIV